MEFCKDVPVSEYGVTGSQQVSEPHASIAGSDFSIAPSDCGVMRVAFSRAEDSDGDGASYFSRSTISIALDVGCIPVMLVSV